MLLFEHTLFATYIIVHAEKRFAGATYFMSSQRIIVTTQIAKRLVKNLISFIKSAKYFNMLRSALLRFGMKFVFL